MAASHRELPGDIVDVKRTLLRLRSLPVLCTWGGVNLSISGVAWIIKTNPRRIILRQVLLITLVSCINRPSTRQHKPDHDHYPLKASWLSV
jgi:hypothetical protein